jgi:hypothetical protein
MKFKIKIEKTEESAPEFEEVIKTGLKLNDGFVLN